MSTTDGAIDQKSFNDLQGIYYHLLPKTVLKLKNYQQKNVLKLANSTDSVIRFKQL